MKTGIVDVGGGLRGIYGAGVFDYCLDHEIYIDYGIGVSAGSANISSYLAGQKKRNWYFYYEYAFRSKYMSLRNLLHHGSYINMDYVYGSLSNSDGENPLDYEALVKNPAEMKVVAANAMKDGAMYFDKEDMTPDHYDILKASCSIPVVCKPYEIQHEFYFDGGLADPVPVRKALEDGCDKLILILTKPLSVVRTSDKDKNLARLLRHKYPVAAENLMKRAQRYNDAVSYTKELAKQGKAVIIAPDNIGRADTLTKNKEILQRLYTKGYQDAEKIEAFLG